MALALLPACSARCDWRCKEEYRRRALIKPPPPPPLNLWKSGDVANFVGDIDPTASKEAIRSSGFDGEALHELWLLPSVARIGFESRSACASTASVSSAITIPTSAFSETAASSEAS
ncbi:MAG: hypothetical protein SGPRY_004770 [Prymnesium sp.]